MQSGKGRVASEVEPSDLEFRSVRVEQVLRRYGAKKKTAFVLCVAKPTDSNARELVEDDRGTGAGHGIIRTSLVLAPLSMQSRQLTLYSTDHRKNDCIAFSSRLTVYRFLTATPLYLAISPVPLDLT